MSKNVGEAEKSNSLKLQTYNKLSSTYAIKKEKPLFRRHPQVHNDKNKHNTPQKPFY